MQFQIPFEPFPIEAHIDEVKNPSSLLILAHGAGAPMNHTFLEKLALEFNLSGISVLRFNFPYVTQGKKLPGNPKPNINAWKVVTEWALRQYNQPTFISGKSYGGRMASHLLAEDENISVRGIIYFGFPLHAPGKKSLVRYHHLKK